MGTDAVAPPAVAAHVSHLPPVSTMFAALLGYSRVPYASSRAGHFFRFFATLHPTGQFPHRSLLLIGGGKVSTTVEGRQRFPVNVRYARDFRSDVEALKETLVPADMGGQAVQVPLGQLARISYTDGPDMISSENSLLRSIVFLNVRGRDMGGFVEEAKKKLDEELKLPPGYFVSWSGQWENQIRAKKRLELLLPLVLVIIFVLLYFTFHSALEASMVMLSVPFALVGGVYLVWALGYYMSVAVWVGFIALYGVAVETGVVMVIYLHEALDKRLARGPVTEQDIYDATFEGAVLRLRPKLMTVSVALMGLLPIMWSTGTGADVMSRIAAPMIGGMISSSVHVLIMTPVIFVLMKKRDLKKGRLKYSGMGVPGHECPPEPPKE